MTPNADSAPSGPSRRSSLASTAIATAAVAGGMPLLTACGGSDSESREGTASGTAADELLPAYVASTVAQPDLPPKNGSAAGYTGKVDLAALKTSVRDKLGTGAPFHMSAWYTKTTEQAKSNPDFQIGAMDSFGADGGTPTRWASKPAGIWSMIRKGASKQMIANALAAADFAAAPYGTKERMLVDYGVEDTHYTVTDGVPVQNDRGNSEVVNAWSSLAARAPRQERQRQLMSLFKEGRAHRAIKG